MRVDGVGRLSAKLSAIPPRTERSIRDELGDVGEDLKRRSQDVAPKDTGHLRKQAFSDVSRGVGGPSVEIGYNGPANYLLVQHEGMWLNFMGNQGPKDIQNYTTPGTGPKFLERPWLASKGGYVEDIKDAAREGVNGRG